MLSELDETIRRLLIDEGGFDPAEIDVSFDIPNREWSVGITKPTLNCYLFDIRENGELRQQGMQTEKGGSGSAGRRRPRLFFDLTYLITAWTRAVEDEHRLLWHTLTTLVRFTTLPAEHLQGRLRENDVPIFARAAQPSSVLKSPGEFWTALENQLKPSLSYVVTLGLDRDLLPAGPPVLTTALRFLPETAPASALWFGGAVRDATGVPVPEAIVEIEGHAFQAITDIEGKFRLRIPAPGRYTLVTRHGAVTRRSAIEIPTTTYDITL